MHIYLPATLVTVVETTVFVIVLDIISTEVCVGDDIDGERMDLVDDFIVGITSVVDDERIVDDDDVDDDRIVVDDVAVSDDIVVDTVGDTVVDTDDALVDTGDGIVMDVDDDVTVDVNDTISLLVGNAMVDMDSVMATVVAVVSTSNDEDATITNVRWFNDAVVDIIPVHGRI